ncbi:UNVERIFIED_CONTAM: hypothetical protein BEN50_15055 [Euhalothece sp. KZN 001]
MALEFFEGAVTSPSGASDGVFIPISDLPGVVAGEFANSDGTELKTAKAILGAFYALNNNRPSNALGLTINRNTNSGGLDLTNNSFTLTPQFYIDHETKQMDALPLPTSGDNSGVGGVSIQDIYPNAEKVAADGAISGEGFLIPSIDIEPFGAPDHASLDITADQRLWFLGLGQWLTTDSSILVRQASQASAITARSRGGTTAVTLPPVATEQSNPTTGLSASDLNKISVVSHALAITVQTKMNQETQTFDVNVVTA